LLSIRSLSLSAGILAMVASANAEIDYHVTVAPTEKLLKVEIAVPAEGPTTSIQIANWMPGAYSYSNFYQNVTAVAATDSKGKNLVGERGDRNR